MFVVVWWTAVIYCTVQRRCDKWLIASFSKTPCISPVCSNMRHSSQHFICQLAKHSHKHNSILHCACVVRTYISLILYITTPIKSAWKWLSTWQMLVGYYLTAMQKDDRSLGYMINTTTVCTSKLCMYIRMYVGEALFHWLLFSWVDRNVCTRLLCTNFQPIYQCGGMYAQGLACY